VLLSHQQGYVIDPFSLDVYFCHSGTSLTQFGF